jgi:sugar O-acyltransferase (sialic acid O-acetyltransferase NeuD family)
METKEKVLIGAGGFAREIIAESKLNLKCYVDDQYYRDGLYKISEFNPEKQIALISNGNPKDRKLIVSRLPKNTEFWSYVSPKAILLDDNIDIGVGVFICSGCILTTNIKIGNHVHLNLNTTVGHDAVLSDFVTTAPNVNISGNVFIGEEVYLGTNSVIKEKIKITSNVIIGLNAGVVKDIIEQGTYIGTPAVKMK